MSLPIAIGEGPAYGRIVARMDLSLDALEWLIAELPQDDGFTRDLWKDYERVLAAIAVDEAARAEMPGLVVSVFASSLSETKGTT